MIFSPIKQEVTNCSKEIWDFSRDQMMLGGYKYDAFYCLKDLVENQIENQLLCNLFVSQFTSFNFVEKYSEDKLNSSEPIFLHQNVYHKEPKEKKQPTRGY